MDIICDIPPAQNGSGFPEWLKYAYPRFLFIDVSNILINMFGNLAWVACDRTLSQKFRQRSTVIF